MVTEKNFFFLLRTTLLLTSTLIFYSNYVWRTFFYAHLYFLTCVCGLVFTFHTPYCKFLILLPHLLKPYTIYTPICIWYAKYVNGRVHSIFYYQLFNQSLAYHQRLHKLSQHFRSNCEPACLSDNFDSPTHSLSAELLLSVVSLVYLWLTAINAYCPSVQRPIRQLSK